MALFGKIREKISKLTNKIAAIIETREISERELSQVLDDFKLELIESDIAFDVAEQIVEKLRRSLIGARIPRGGNIEGAVRKALAETLRSLIPEPPGILEEIRRKCERGEPYVIMVMGVNGVGKTTSIAKLANYLKENGLSVLLVAADTFRAGAQEQLIKHAENIGIPVLRAKYGSDPGAVAYDAIQHARKRKYCVVIIDTAGRMHTDPDLMSELKKISRVVKPDFKLLVIDALTGNDAVEQSRAFNEHIGVDGFFLTKADADVKGGSGISASLTTGRPIIFLGTGQKYGDIIPFSRSWIIEKIVGPDA